MKINVELNIKGITDFQTENKDRFENDLRETVRELLVIQGIDFESIKFGFDYEERSNQ